MSVTLWLSADYKFLLLVLGFKCATARFSCIYCKADLLNPTEWNEQRELDERDATGDPDESTGQPRKNLFPFIERTRCRVDVLHLLLRCMDRFIHTTALLFLRELAPKLAKDEHKLEFLNKKLAPAIGASAGRASITIIKQSNMYKLTRCTGDNYRSLLRTFKFANHLPPTASARKEAVLHQQMWDDFSDIYDSINTKAPYDATRIQAEIRSWFAACLNGQTLPTTKTSKGKTRGSKKARRRKKTTTLKRCQPLFLASYLLTPYFHSLLNHVPQMIRLHGEIYSFTGQNFEKANNVHQRGQQVSNGIRGDDCSQVIHQDLRTKLNPMSRLDQLQRIECDSPDCSKTYSRAGDWSNHRKAKHPTLDCSLDGERLAFNQMTATKDNRAEFIRAASDSFVTASMHAYDATKENKRRRNKTDYPASREKTKRTKAVTMPLSPPSPVLAPIHILPYPSLQSPEPNTPIPSSSVLTS